MATLEQLSTALINADKAGDTHAATSIAQEIKKMRAAPAQAPTQTGTVTGQILPFQKDLSTGETSLAVPGLLRSLYDSASSAITAPGRAMSGELPVIGSDGNTSPQAIAEGLNFAGWASPASVASRNGFVQAPAQRMLSEGQETALAANRLGVDLPRAAASDSTSVQQLGKIATNIPIGGTPLRKGARVAIDQLGNAAQRVQQGFGAGDVAAAGSLARQGIRDFSENTLDNLVTKKYNAVDSLVDPKITAPLTATTTRVAKLLDDRQKAALPSEGSAASIVRDAISRPEGLTYEGVKRLRTEVGQMLKNPQMAPAGTSQDELRSLYGSLSDDLRATVKKAGGDKAAAAFDDANTFAAKTIQEQKALDKIVAPKSDEGLFGSIQAMAGSTNRADIQNLARVKRSVSPETWNEISSSVISRIGRDTDGNFSPDRFLTGYGKLSQNGKNLLFGGNQELKSSLDDIATVSRRFKELNQFANPSGTGQTIIGGSYLPGLYLEPVSVISSIAGTRVLSSALSKPTSAKKLAEWAKAYEQAAVNPTVKTQNMLGVRARVLSLSLANDAGNTSIVNQLINPLSRVQKAAAGQENSPSITQQPAGGQNDQPRMLMPNEL